MWLSGGRVWGNGTQRACLQGRDGRMRSDKVGRVRNAGCLVSSPINDACSLLGRQEQSGRSGGDGWKVNLNLNLKIKTFIYLFICLFINLLDIFGNTPPPSSFHSDQQPTRPVHSPSVRRDASRPRKRPGPACEARLGGHVPLRTYNSTCLGRHTHGLEALRPP